MTVRKPSRHLIHEVDQTRRQHRIVIMQGSVPLRGDWADLHQLAHFKGLTAAAGEFSGLPLGIFRAQQQPHEVLS